MFPWHRQRKAAQQFCSWGSQGRAVAANPRQLSGNRRWWRTPSRWRRPQRASGTSTKYGTFKVFKRSSKTYSSSQSWLTEISGCNEPAFFLARNLDQLKTWFMSDPKPSLACKFYFLAIPSRAQLGYPTCFRAWLRFKVCRPAQPSQLGLFGSSFSELSSEQGLKLCRKVDIL